MSSKKKLKFKLSNLLRNGKYFFLRYINLYKEDNLTPEFLKLNPSGTVPVLVDGDVTVWDSHAIMIYLAEKFSSHLLCEQIYPRDFLKRTLVNERLFFEASFLFARLFEICVSLVKTQF